MSSLSARAKVKRLLLQGFVAGYGEVTGREGGWKGREGIDEVDLDFRKIGYREG